MNERERRFCEEYLIDLNAVQAALRAGYSAKTAKNASCWIQRKRPSKPKLREEIDRRIAERSRRTGVSSDRVLQELARIAFADVTDLLTPDAADVREDISRDDSAALAKLKRRRTRDGVECEVHLYDKNRALELLGKHLGLFNGDARAPQAQPVIIDDVEEEPDGER